MIDSVEDFSSSHSSKADAPSMSIVLTVISESYEGKMYTIEPDQCVAFGRTSPSRWIFDRDEFMSGVHFKVVSSGQDVEVRDCGSTNGTRLNNRLINQEKLREGDRILAGRTMFTIEFIKRLSARARHPQASRPVNNPIEDDPPWNSYALLNRSSNGR